MHADGGRGEGVVRGEHEGAPVLAAFVGGVGGAGEDIVPFEDVLLRGVGDDVGRGGLGDGGVFAGEALGCGGGGHGVYVGERNEVGRGGEREKVRVGNECQSRVFMTASDLEVVT